MGIEPMTFRKLAGRSTTEPQELMASEVTILGYDTRIVSHYILWPRSPYEFPWLSDRVSDKCTEGHGFDSHLELRFSLSIYLWT